jgi:Nitroreductase family
VSACRTGVVVHDVAGLPPGVYRWPSLAAPARPGQLRAELRRVCLGQGLPHDAAFVVIAAARLDGLDDRDYREAQLSAGLAEGRLALAAYALGAGASGMTFLDSEIPALLGEPLDALLFTCVGVPEYPSARAGQPGAPAEVRMVQPRSTRRPPRGHPPRRPAPIHPLPRPPRPPG